jgi:hypothetical protein
MILKPQAMFILASTTETAVSRCSVSISTLTRVFHQAINDLMVCLCIAEEDRWRNHKRRMFGVFRVSKTMENIKHHLIWRLFTSFLFLSLWTLFVYPILKIIKDFLLFSLKM